MPDNQKFRHRVTAMIDFPCLPGLQATSARGASTNRRMNVAKVMRMYEQPVVAAMPPEMRAVFETLHQNNLNDVLQEHGLGAFRCSKRCAALHEAGHAVVYAAWGTPVEWLKIKPGDPISGWGGFTKGAAGDVTIFGKGAGWQQNFRSAQFFWAGLAAENVFDVLYPGSSQDEYVLAQMAMMFSREDYVALAGDEWSQDEAWRDMQLATAQLIEDNADIVEAIANLLMKSITGKVMATKLDALLKRVDASAIEPLKRPWPQRYIPDRDLLAEAA
jgi:hypothetical protein